MTILLSTLGVAFAAFCVWLVVRVVNRRERWAKWTAVALIGPLLAYPASFGPACWLADSDAMPRFNELALPIYEPLILFCRDDNGMASQALRRYSGDGGSSWFFGVRVKALFRMVEDVKFEHYVGEMEHDESTTRNQLLESLKSFGEVEQDEQD